MKKFLTVSLTAVSTMLLLTATAQAEMIKLSEVGVDPSELVGIKGVVNAYGYAGQYKLKTVDNEILDAFCVDPQYSTPNKFFNYEVTEVTGKYAKAAWLWENMSTLGNDAVATQIAIWEVTWENEYNVANLGTGNFILSSATTATRTTAISMLNQLASADLSSFSTEGYRIVKSPYTQDYLIRHSVPEPGSLLMMLIGAVCLVGYRRKFR